MMTKTTSSLTAKKGFNLIELAFVLGVVGLAFSGLWVAGAAINNAQKISAHQQQLVGTYNNMLRLWKGQDPSSLCAGNCSLSIGTQMQRAGVVVGDTKNPWGGSIDIKYSGFYKFEIVSRSIPQDACNELFAKLIGMLKNEPVGTAIFVANSSDTNVVATYGNNHPSTWQALSTPCFTTSNIWIEFLAPQ